MEEEKCNQMWKELQIYLPYLREVICHLKDPGKENGVQVSKLEGLISMISNKEKKIKLSTLRKSEEIILNILRRMNPNIVRQLAIEKLQLVNKEKSQLITTKKSSPPRNKPDESKDKSKKEEQKKDTSSRSKPKKMAVEFISVPSTSKDEHIIPVENDLVRKELFGKRENTLGISNMIECLPAAAKPVSPQLVVSSPTPALTYSQKVHRKKVLQKEMPSQPAERVEPYATEKSSPPQNKPDESKDKSKKEEQKKDTSSRSKPKKMAVEFISVPSTSKAVHILQIKEIPVENDLVRKELFDRRENTLGIPNMIERLPAAAKPVSPQLVVSSPTPALTYSQKVHRKKVLRKEMPSQPAERVEPYKNRNALENLLIESKLVHLYKCPQFSCHYSTEYYERFDVHLKQHVEHTTDPAVTCLYCGFITCFSLIGLHCEIRHSNLSFCCAYCFYRACDQSLVEIHEEDKHADKTVRVLVAPPNPSILKTRARITIPDIKEVLMPYSCGQLGCEEKFVFETDFKRHLVARHRGMPLLCAFCTNTPVDEEAAVVHAQTHNISYYNCRYCVFAAGDMHDINKHLSEVHFMLTPSIIAREYHDNGTGKASSEFVYPDDSVFDHVLIQASGRNISVAANVVQDISNNITRVALEPDQINELVNITNIYLDESITCARCGYESKVPQYLLRHSRHHLEDSEVPVEVPVPVEDNEVPVPTFSLVNSLSSSRTEESVEPALPPIRLKKTTRKSTTKQVPVPTFSLVNSLSSSRTEESVEPALPPIRLKNTARKSTTKQTLPNNRQ